jgi:hypothetical protein
LQRVHQLDVEFKNLFGDGSLEGQEDESFSSGGSGQQFMQRFGWHYQSELVSRYEGIKLDEVYELPTIQYLNDLAYLKEKSNYEREAIKKASAKNVY